MDSLATATERRIRAATSRDRMALAEIYARCRRLAEWLPETERRRADFERDTSGEEIHVAIGADGAIEGFVSVWRPQSFIHHLYVRPEAQRAGVGGALLDSLVGHYPYPWRLKCVRVNRAAMAFYRARGWSEVGRGRGVQGEHAVLELAR